MEIHNFIWSIKLGKTLTIMSIGKDLEHQDIVWRNNVRHVIPKIVKCEPDQVVLMDGKYNEAAVFWVLKKAEIDMMIHEGKATYNRIPRNWQELKRRANQTNN